MEESQLKNIPTLILGELPPVERDRYFKFLLENDVKFVEDEQGYYVAVIKVVNPNSKFHSVTRQDKSPSRAMQSTFSHQQKAIRTESPSFSSRKPVRKSPERSKSSIRERSPQNMRGISELLAIETKQKVNPETDLKKIPEKKPVVKSLLADCKYSKLVECVKQEPSELRPKLLSVKILLKLIEEIYSAKHKKEVSTEDESIRKKFHESLEEFIISYYTEKLKNKRMVSQAVLDLAETIMKYENQYKEIELFSLFLAEVYDTPVLLFFLFIRNTIERTLDIHFAPSKNYIGYPGEKVAVESSQVFLSYKQCIKVALAVFPDEESLQRLFLGNLAKEFQIKDETSIKLIEFFKIFVEVYHAQETGGVLEENPDETFPESTIHYDPHEAEGESEILKSFDVAPVFPIRNNSESSIASSRLSSKKSPFDEMKHVLLEYSDNTLVNSFFSIFLDEHPEVVKSLKEEAEDLLKIKMRELIEAVCDCDKRRWLDSLGTSDRDSLKIAENIEKKLREVMRRGSEISMEEIEEICKSILEASYLRKYISDLLGALVNG